MGHPHESVSEIAGTSLLTASSSDKFAFANPNLWSTYLYRTTTVIIFVSMLGTATETFSWVNGLQLTATKNDFSLVASKDNHSPSPITASQIKKLAACPTAKTRFYQVRHRPCRNRGLYPNWGSKPCPKITLQWANVPSADVSANHVVLAGLIQKIQYELNSWNNESLKYNSIFVMSLKCE